MPESCGRSSAAGGSLLRFRFHRNANSQPRRRATTNVQLLLVGGKGSSRLVVQQRGERQLAPVVVVAVQSADYDNDTDSDYEEECYCSTEPPASAKHQEGGI